MNRLLLHRPVEPLGDAVGPRLGGEGVARRDAPEPDLLAEIVRSVLRTVIHTLRQPAARVGDDRAKLPADDAGTPSSTAPTAPTPVAIPDIRGGIPAASHPDAGTLVETLMYTTLGELLRDALLKNPEETGRLVSAAILRAGLPIPAARSPVVDAQVSAETAATTTPPSGFQSALPSVSGRVPQ